MKPIQLRRSKKLSLKKETVRELAPVELKDAAGGRMQKPTCTASGSCVTTTSTCP